MSDFAVSGHWKDDFDDAALTTWAQQLRQSLRAPRVSLGLLFMTPHYFEAAARILEVLRVHAEIPLLLGCSSTSLIVGGREIEDEPGLEHFHKTCSLLILEPAGRVPHASDSCARARAHCATL
jgi:small ligand-binding sensory domain FIST